MNTSRKRRRRDADIRSAAAAARRRRRTALVCVCVCVCVFGVKVQSVLLKKPEVADFSRIARLLNVPAHDMNNEWRILRRLPMDLSTHEQLIHLAVSPEKVAMFTAFSTAVRKLPLLPIGKANFERSFSTMNRILSSSQRCRLLPELACQLMQLSVEGLHVPDVRNVRDNEKQAFDQ